MAAALLLCLFTCCSSSPPCPPTHPCPLSAGFAPRDYAYCGLIAAHSFKGDWAAALRVRERMRSAGVVPTVHVSGFQAGLLQSAMLWLGAGKCRMQMRSAAGRRWRHMHASQPPHSTPYSPFTPIPAGLQRPDCRLRPRPAVRAGHGTGTRHAARRHPCKRRHAVGEQPVLVGVDASCCRPGWGLCGQGCLCSWHFTLAGWSGA